MQEFNIGRAWNFNIELQRSRGVAIAILGRRCLMGQLLLWSSMLLIGLVDQLSVPIWEDGDHRAGSQRRQSWTDQHIWLLGVSVSVVHRCRSLLLSFSIIMLSRYIRSWGGYKLHIGSNLPPKDNLRKEDKSSAPKVSFIRRFHCTQN